MPSMDIEVVSFKKLVGTGKTKAFADVKIANELILKGFSVTQGSKGIFVGMPRQVGKDGVWFDTVKLLNGRVKAEIESKVLEVYDRENERVTV